MKLFWLLFADWLIFTAKGAKIARLCQQQTVFTGFFKANSTFFAHYLRHYPTHY